MNPTKYDYLIVYNTFNNGRLYEKEIIISAYNIQQAIEIFNYHNNYKDHATYEVVKIEKIDLSKTTCCERSRLFTYMYT